MVQFGPEVNADDIVSVDDAVERTGISRNTLFRLIRAGSLTRVKRAGDRRTYLKLSELSTQRSFREVRAPYDPPV
jgi:predicted site-specific integrase-resolvase